MFKDEFQILRIELMAWLYVFGLFIKYQRKP